MIQTGVGYLRVAEEQLEEIGQTGQMDQALSLQEETLKKQQATLGPDHPYTLTCMNNLAFVYQAVAVNSVRSVRRPKRLGFALRRFYGQLSPKPNLLDDPVADDPRLFGLSVCALGAMLGKSSVGLCSWALLAVGNRNEFIEI